MFRASPRTSGTKVTRTLLHLPRVILLAGLTAISAQPAGAGPFSFVSGSEMLTAVNSREFNGYVRSRLPDGSFRPETFAFGDGDVLPVPIVPGLLVADPTIDQLGFTEIAKMLAEPLASQNYVRAIDPKTTDLLIMVYWGRTIGTTRILDGNAQDAVNFFNASLMGFDEDAHYLGESSGNTIIGGIIRNVHADTLSAVAVDRYYVILRAFDFQSAWKGRRRKLLWETRFSLSERGHDFGRELPAMAQTASIYFGQDSYGMVRTPLVPEGYVHIGELKAIEDQPGADDTESQEAVARFAGNWESATDGFRVRVHIDREGHSTFEDLRRGEALPARVSVKDGTVTVTVPGWDVLYRGKPVGDHLFGMISEYGRRNTLILSKED
jgi:hypothetical protein